MYSGEALQSALVINLPKHMLPQEVGIDST